MEDISATPTEQESDELTLVITNEDFGLEHAELGEDCRKRYASRGIVVNPETGKIAVIAKKNIHEYKLPGGGKEADESEEETFSREIMEETGCEVNITKKLGTVIEERAGVNQRQVSSVFVSELIRDTGELNPTEDEIREGLTIEWMTVDDAEVALRESYDTVTGDSEEDVYVAHFVIKRDMKILEAYKQSANK